MQDMRFYSWFSEKNVRVYCTSWMNLLQRASLFHSINCFHLSLKALKKKKKSLCEFLFSSMSANFGIHILWQVWWQSKQTLSSHAAELKILSAQWFKSSLASGVCWILRGFLVHFLCLLITREDLFSLMHKNNLNCWILQASIEPNGHSLRC